jgi:hypothetical protein
MKINIAPNTNQIRHYAESALRVWDVLPPDLARENVIAHMEALLHYLDVCDAGNGVIVAGIRKIERGVRLEVSHTRNQIFDLTDCYMGENTTPDHAANAERPILGDIEDMRSHGDGNPGKPEIDLKSLSERGFQG